MFNLQSVAGSVSVAFVKLNVRLRQVGSIHDGAGFAEIQVDV